MNIRSATLFLMLILISRTVSAQSPLVGKWKGKIVFYAPAGKNDIAKNMKLNITDAETAEFLIEDVNTKDYIPFSINSRYSKYRTSQFFKLSGNFAHMIISKKSEERNGQEVLNIAYVGENNKIALILTDLTIPVENNNSVIATGELINEEVKTYSGNNLLVGGQSYNYVKIESIEKGKYSTEVTLKFKNSTSANILGTIHKPGSATAFYITNSDRSKKYKLISADKDLPLSIEVKPGGSYYIKLKFEAIPPGMNLMNIFEGGSPEATNLWKFYDVRLKD